MIPYPIVYALEDFEPSYVEIKYSDPIIIKQEFDRLFKRNWEKAYKNTVENIGIDPKEEPDYYPCTADESYPANSVTVKGKMLAFLAPLYISYCYGEFCELMEPYDALNNTLEELQERYPESEISGYVAFPWSDRRCGDIEEYSLGREKEIYPMIAEIINSAIKGETIRGFKIEDPEDSFSFKNRLLDELKEIYETEDMEAFFDFLTTYWYLFTKEAKTVLLDIVKEAKENIDEEEVIEVIEKRIPEFR